MSATTRLRDWLRHPWTSARTIRVRLTLWYVALLATILIVFAGFLYFNLARNLHAEVDRSLSVQAQQVMASLDIENGTPKSSDGLDNLPAGMAAALYDPAGVRRIAHIARQPFPVVPEALGQAAQGRQNLVTTRLPNGDAWRVLTTPVVENGHIAGVLQVARSEREVELALQQLVLLMVVAIPLLLLLAVAGGLFLAGRALDPIDRITRAAEQIGAEDLTRRLNLPSSGDEVGRLAATFDQMLDRLDRAFQRQRQFTADASHELRTPLAMLTSQVDVALERPRPVVEYRRVLASVREDASRLAQLLGELLTLARADAGQETLITERLDLNDLAADVVASMLPLAHARGLDLVYHGIEPVFVCGDQTRLTQLLVNLVGNGLKFTPAGETVTVAVERHPGQAVLRVADTGVGIAAEHLPHLFERFYRVDEARARADGGSGLGLAISQWIARAHGGDILVASRLGHGTTFTVLLPLAPDPTPPANSDQRQRGAPTPPRATSRSRSPASLK